MEIETQSACPSPRRIDIHYFSMALLQLALACGRAHGLLVVHTACSLLPALPLQAQCTASPNPVSVVTSIYNIGSHCLRRKLRPVQERHLLRPVQERHLGSDTEGWNDPLVWNQVRGTPQDQRPISNQ